MNVARLTAHSSIASELLRNCLDEKGGDNIEGLTLYLNVTLSPIFAGSAHMGRKERELALKALIGLVRERALAVANATLTL